MGLVHGILFRTGVAPALEARSLDNQTRVQVMNPPFHESGI